MWYVSFDERGQEPGAEPGPQCRKDRDRAAPGCSLSRTVSTIVVRVSLQECGCALHLHTVVAIRRALQPAHITLRKPCALAVLQRERDVTAAGAPSTDPGARLHSVDAR
eukprot:scaffold114196_cov63-Phaeocystis_antarctica.AAC.5